FLLPHGMPSDDRECTFSSRVPPKTLKIKAPYKSWHYQFSSDDIEATARRTGFVKRASKLTGKLFLALVTFGAWSDATTTLAQLAAKVTHLDEQVEVSPEAIHQRMNQRALAFLQDMIRQALAKVQSREKVCDDGLFTDFTKVYLADSTGFELPESLHDLFP